VLQTFTDWVGTVVGVTLGVRVASSVCVEVGDGVDVRVEVADGGGVDEGVCVGPAVLVLAGVDVDPAVSVLEGVRLVVGEAFGSSVAAAVDEWVGSEPSSSVVVEVAGIWEEGALVAVTWTLIRIELSVGLMKGSPTIFGGVKIETAFSRLMKSFFMSSRKPSRNGWRETYCQGL
jgi:hypothetical protein